MIQKSDKILCGKYRYLISLIIRLIGISLL
nr:MAG TPA: hypothetical protein [Caudoviricetes sp.]